MYKRNIIIAILNFASVIVCAQQYKPTLYLKPHQDKHISEFCTYWLQSFSESENVVLADSMYKQGAFKHWALNKTLSLGDVRKRLWLRIAICNEDSSTTNFLWSIHDFLDTANLYIIKDKISLPEVSSDTYWNIASKRIFPARPLCLPFSLNYDNSATLYLCISEYNNNIYFPMYVRSTVDFMQMEKNFLVDHYWFWLIGFYVFSIVFNLILFSFLRDKLYLWYCLYVAFNTIFLLMEDSLDGLIVPQWLYSAIWHFGQYSFLLLSTGSGIRIMQLFIAQKINQPRIYTLGKILALISFLFPSVIFILRTYFFEHPEFYLLNILKTGRDFLIFINLFFIIFSLIVGFSKSTKIILYYGITYVFFFLSCIMFMTNHLGLTSINKWEPNVLAWGLFFELLTLSVLLTGRFRRIIQQSAELSIQYAERERMETRKLLETQEAERQRIAEDLHDDVGGTISTLQLHISNLSQELISRDPLLEGYFKKATSLSAKAASDIRNISHNLLPKDFIKLGLFQVLQNRIDELNILQPIRFILDLGGIDSILSYTYMVTIYRIINELIHNIIKHSKASEAILQIVVNHPEVLIMVEDNGVGITNIEKGDGIGLKNIRSRVAFLKGELNIDSNTKGTSIIINLSLSN